MYNFKGSQRGCDRLDVGQVNSAMSIISNPVDLKAMYLGDGVRAFTQKVYQPVFSLESFKIAFLFINSVRILKSDFDSYPSIPNVNQIEMYDTTGNTLIGYTVAVNDTGNFNKDDINPSYVIVGSYRYLELTLDDDNYYYYLYRFKYNGSNAENGEFTCKGVNGTTNIWNIPIKGNSDSIYTPNTYNYPLNESLIQEAYLKTNGRIIGYSHNYYPNTQTDSEGTLTFRIGDINPFLTNGELFQLGFITDSKVNSSFFTRKANRGGLQLVGNNVYTHADGYRFVLLTFKTTGVFDGEFKISHGYEDGHDYTLSFLGGIFLAFGTFGAIQYTGITDRELAGVMSNNTGTTVDFVDNYNVNSIIQHSLLTYYTDFTNTCIKRTGLRGVLTLGTTGLPYKLEMISQISSSDSDTIDTGRGCFIIS